MQTTVTIWIPKSDLENFKTLNIFLQDENIRVSDIVRGLREYPIKFYTEPRHVETLQLNVSLDLFVKLNLK